MLSLCVYYDLYDLIWLTTLYVIWHDFDASVAFAHLTINIVMGAAIAQWIHLRLPSCRPGFDSQACHQRFFSIIVKFVLYLSMQCEKRTKINKKEAGFGPFKKKQLTSFT